MNISEVLHYADRLQKIKQFRKEVFCENPYIGQLLNHEEWYCIEVIRSHATSDSMPSPWITKEVIWESKGQGGAK